MEIINVQPQDEVRTRKFIKTAGVWYGIIFGLLLVLFSWGFDGWILHTVSADMPWLKLLIGLPLTVAICGLTGFIAASSSATVISITSWMVACGLIAWVAGHIPFDGTNLAIWLVENRLWGEVIFPSGYSAAVRTTLLVIVSVLLGGVVGFLEGAATQLAWDRSTDDGKMSFGSWIMLSISLPLALILAFLMSGLINRPLRLPQETVGKLIRRTLAGDADIELNMGASYRSIKPYIDQITPDYESYFVAFSSETGTWFSAYIDTAFDNGFVMRCVTLGDTVAYCSDFSEEVRDWMDNLIHVGLDGEQHWLEKRGKKFDVTQEVLDWLEAHREQLSLNYDLTRKEQYGGWFYVDVKFDNGFRMVCRFRGAAPVIVDQCVAPDN